jgi:DnaK suppressor protein
MIEEKKSELKELLKSQLSRVKEQLNELESANVPIVKDCSLDALNKEDMSNKEEQDYKIVLKLKKREERLKSALRVVDSSEYGLCAECDEEIAFERLKLLPESTYCVDCLEEMQRA